MARATVLYDRECGLCRWSADRLRRWDRRGSLRFVPLQGSEADRHLGHLSAEARSASWHIVDEAGHVISAGAAIPAVLRLLPGGRPLAAVAARSPRATERAYGWVADHRGAIGRLLGRRACDLHAPAR